MFVKLQVVIGEYCVFCESLMTSNVFVHTSETVEYPLIGCWFLLALNQIVFADAE